MFKKISSDKLIASALKEKEIPLQGLIEEE